MNLDRLVPATPVRRARLAFLALGLLAVILAWAQLAFIAGDSAVQGWAALAAAVILLAWVGVYRAERPTWWADLAISGALFLYLAALPLPDLGLSLVYVAVYISAFYGTRLQSARGVILMLAAYVAAEITAGALQSPVIRLFMSFQIPSLVVTGAIIRALHESLRTQESLTEQVEELIRMEAVIRLTGGIAHDFNNHLTAILGSLELAQNELGQSEDHGEATEDLELARESVMTARALTAQLQAFSRTASIVPVEIEVDARLREMEPELKEILGPDTDLGVRPAADDALVLMDSAAFDQSVCHLVRNARDALKETGGEGSVTIRSRRVPASEVPPELVHDAGDAAGAGAKYVVVSVEDTGPGMKPEVRRRAFEPFFTTREDGSGLGLSTVYGIVTRAGGQVTLEAREGGGLAANLYLPIHREGG